MDETLKQSILRNPFVTRLRLEWVVDEDAYAALCDALRRLAGKTQVVVPGEDEAPLHPRGRADRPTGW